MGKILLFGGNSELGLATAARIMEVESGIDKCIRISRSLGSDICWDPSNTDSVAIVLNSIAVEQGDLCIISLGSLGEIGNKSVVSEIDFREDIERILWVNALLPMQVFFWAINRLSLAGGGKVVIFSSVAAHPVLPTNSIYGQSKRLLEGVISDYLDLNKKDLQGTVDVSFVLPAFVPTPLNSGRKPTFFATTTESVASSVAKNLGQRFIWVPRIFRIIEIVLIFQPFKRFASSLILKSVKD